MKTRIWTWFTGFAGVLLTTTALAALDDLRFGLPEGNERVVVEPPPCHDCFAPGTNSPPEPPATVTITGRTDSTISLTWRDNSSFEQGYEVQRAHIGLADWTTVYSRGPLGQNEWASFTDEGLSPDTAYAYRVYAYNAFGYSRPSQIRWAYTQDGQNLTVWRIQITLRTADVSDAGTDDAVSISLNGGDSLPAGNLTWLDYGREDFERGDVFTYDLNLEGVKEGSDITRIAISKEGNDAWCLEGFSLAVNGTPIYDEYFGNTASLCRWLDAHSSPYIVSHAMLRSHPLWVIYESPDVREIAGLNFDEPGYVTATLTFPRDELESRIESIVGHLLRDIDEAYWGSLHGRGHVEVSKAAVYGDHTISVDLDLAGDVPLWFDPEIDIDFDLQFEARVDEEDNALKLEIATTRFAATVDFDWLIETLDFLLPCGPVVSVIQDEGIPFCIPYLEDRIEQAVEGAFQTIGKELNIGELPDTTEDVSLSVDEDGSVSLIVRLRLSPPAPEERVGLTPRGSHSDAPDTVPQVHPADNKSPTTQVGRTSHPTVSTNPAPQ